jgi:hypothetical protein
MRIKVEQTVCEWVGVRPCKPKPNTKVAIALGTLGKLPMSGFRQPATENASGWYLWCGQEFSRDEKFFSTLHMEQLREYLPEVVEYLDLPPGFRFLIGGSNYEDVWFDDELLKL